MISSDNDYLKNKAKGDTVENIKERIENLSYKINQVKQNIEEQFYMEVHHAECK